MVTFQRAPRNGTGMLRMPPVLQPHTNHRAWRERSCASRGNHGRTLSPFQDRHLGSTPTSAHLHHCNIACVVQQHLENTPISLTEMVFIHHLHHCLSFSTGVRRSTDKIKQLNATFVKCSAHKHSWKRSRAELSDPLTSPSQPEDGTSTDVISLIKI